MKFIIYTFALSIILFSCEEAPTEEVPEVVEVEQSDFEKELNQQITVQLALKATDKYSYEIFEEDLSTDTVRDAVIIVNMLNKALKEDTMGKSQILKNVGPFNYIFTYDGATKKFSKAPAINSSAEFKPTIKFMNLTSPAYKDFIVEYRINDSGFYNYYTMDKGLVYLIFNAPYFSELTSDMPEAFYHEIIDGKQSLARDIILYKGVIPTFTQSEVENIFEYNPLITNSNEPYIYFFYDVRKKKYVTPQRPN